jgi:NADH dehydrogenase
MSEIFRDIQPPALESAQQQASAVVSRALGPNARRKRVLIVGAGFAGIAAARELRRCDAEVILVDRRNHHIFQPLLYQAATAVLAPSEIAAPIRQLAAKQKNLDVLLGDVSGVDMQTRSVDASCPGIGVRKVPFDYLVIATGMQPSYFGHDEFAKYAPGLKSLNDAETIRARILSAYELAEQTDHEQERMRQMTFVLVGGGPTGVELAASIAHLAAVTLRGQFRRIDPARSEIVLVEGGTRILPAFAESLSRKAARRLATLGVKILTGAKVDKIDADGVVANGTRIACATVLWTAGVSASPLLKQLGAMTDRVGRISVGPFMNVPDIPDVFVVGDASSVVRDGRPVPGVAQAAIQQGRYVGRLIARELGGAQSKRPFQYFDKGNMAVVGKNFAILERGHLRMSGFVTWLVWCVLHVMSLPQPQNKWRVRIQWLLSYFTGQRSSRLIPERTP